MTVDYARCALTGWHAGWRSWHDGTGCIRARWGEAEIDAGWQGIAALGFTDPPPAGFAAELRIGLEAAAGLLAADLALFAPDGSPLPGAVLPVADGALQITVRFAERGPRGTTRVRLLTGEATR